jgi:rSAM/selenodomain-associated transferase 1
MENALIIFVRNSEKGKVKTRLSKSLGDEKTLDVYKYLLQYTSEVARVCHCNLFVFYSDYIHIADVFDDHLFAKHLQEGNDLGERMMNAFEKVFSLGSKKVCIIGSDCYQLETEILDDAFEKLESNEIVIGPAIDGGYYLLGTKQLYTEVFTAKEWGTSAVLDDTIEAINRLKLSYSELPLLNDIDTLEDLLETDILTKLEEDTK